MVAAKQTYKERLRRFLAKGEWRTRTEVILRFGPDYPDALKELHKLVMAGAVECERYKRKTGPGSYKYRWVK